MRFVQSELYYT